MKILFITDTHLTAKTPSSRTDSYELTTMKKFTELGNIIKSNNVDMVLHGGDMFHTAKVSLRYAGHIAEIIKSWGVPVHVVPGNHDLYGYNLKTIDQTMLGLYAKSNVVELLTRDNPLLVDINGCKLAIEGQEYYADIDKGNIVDYRIDTTGADYSILVTHSMLLPKPFFPDIPHTLIKDVVTDANMVLAGHYHPGFDECVVNGTTFINPGATVRVESSRLDAPKVIIFDVSNSGSNLNVSSTYIELKTARKREDIFDLNSKLAKKHSTQVVTAFQQNIDNLSSLQNADTVTDMIGVISNEINVDKSISVKAMSFIGDAEAECDDTSSTVNGFIEKKYKLGVSKVIIKNFQSHSNSIIEFKDGFNVISGESNHGKTAALRAMMWCLFNDPKGTDFIRTGEKECTVKVEFTDKSSITRSRTLASSGHYIVTDVNGESTTYKGFGNDIPVEVQNEHQMPEVYLSKDNKFKLNVSSQLEQHFLVGESPTVRANAVGRLTGVQVVDIAIKNCNRAILATNKEVKVLESKLESYVKEMYKYKDLGDLKLYLTILEDLNNLKDKLESESLELEMLLRNKDILELNKNRTVEVISSIPNTKHMEDGLVSANHVLSQIDYLVSTSNELEELAKRKFEIANSIRYIESISSSVSDLNEAQEIIDETTQLMSYRSSRVELYQGIKKLEMSLSSYERLDELSKIIDDTTDRMNSLCGISGLGEEFNKIVEDKNNKTYSIQGIDNKLKSSKMLCKSTEDSIKELLLEHHECPLCGSEMNLDSVLNSKGGEHNE